MSWLRGVKFYSNFQFEKLGDFLRFEYFEVDPVFIFSSPPLKFERLVEKCVSFQLGLLLRAEVQQLLAETSSICCSGKYETSFWRVVTLNDRVATDINDDSQNGLWGCNLTFFVPFTLYGKNGSKIFPFRNTLKKSCRQNGLSILPLLIRTFTPLWEEDTLSGHLPN